MEQVTKERVARHPELAHAHDVDGSEIDDDAIGAGEALQRFRVVVELERAGIERAERVQQVFGGRGLEQRVALDVGDFLEGVVLYQAVVADPPEAVVVADERVHAVHRDKLFGQRIGR